MTNKTNIEADNARMSEEIKKAILDGMNNLQSTCDCIVREFESKWEQQEETILMTREKAVSITNELQKARVVLEDLADETVYTKLILAIHVAVYDIHQAEDELNKIPIE